MQSTVSTLTLTNADAEYSFTPSAPLSNLTFQCRSAFAVRFATVTGKVATPTDPYATLKAGQSFNLRDLQRVDAAQTWYFASSEAGVVVEIIETINS